MTNKNLTLANMEEHLKIIDLKPYGGGVYTEILECNNKEILFETYKNIADTIVITMLVIWGDHHIIKKLGDIF